MVTDSASLECRYIHDPDDVIDYKIDWSNEIPSGNVITNSEWTLPAGITLSGSVMEDDYTIAWITGGVAGTTYEVLNQITADTSPVQLKKTWKLYLICRD
jgi:hypothetical protein